MIKDDLPSVTIRDLATGAPRCTFQTVDYAHWSLFTPDASAVLVVGNQPGAELYDTRTCARIGLFSGHHAYLSDADFSGDGRFLLTASTDGTPKLWSVADKELLWSTPARIFGESRNTFPTVALDEHATRAYVNGTIHDLAPDDRSPAAIAATIDELVPYRLEDGALMPRPAAAR